MDICSASLWSPLANAICLDALGSIVAAVSNFDHACCYGDARQRQGFNANVSSCQISFAGGERVKIFARTARLMCERNY